MVNEYIIYVIVFNIDSFKAFAEDKVLFQVMFVGHKTKAFWGKNSLGKTKINLMI